jgi:hypothetical protein
MKEVRQLMNEGENGRAQQIMNAWPERVRNLRLMQLLNIQLQSAKENNKEYVAAIERFASEFPDARNAPLLMIDAYFLTENYPKAMDAVNRLDMFVKGDPFLIFYRGLISKMAGDTAAYYDYISKAYAASKDMGDVILEKMFVAHQQGDTAGEREAGQVYRANPKFNQDRLTQTRAMMSE